MTNFVARRHFVAACVCGVLAVAIGSNASGQECQEGGAPADAGAPYVTPTPATCDPSAYISTPDSATGPTSPSTAMFSLPAPYDASPQTFSGDIFATVGVTNPVATNFVYSHVAAPYTDAAGCKAFSDHGHPNVHNCLCDKCFTEMQQCDALVGCQAIITCAWGLGCDPNAPLTSTESCYPLFGGAGCKMQIDSYGTGSVSTAMSQLLGKCGASNGCPAQ
jgi:hypothetical protein